MGRLAEERLTWLLQAIMTMEGEVRLMHMRSWMVGRRLSERVPVCERIQRSLGEYIFNP